ncbi:MAG: LEPR-XLL domain-containing protein, partial [Sedimentisphaerales bacterium]|nr:LEPR-XLL domain-containing protein [Sedimentisphaerales bacterium]
MSLLRKLRRRLGISPSSKTPHLSGVNARCRRSASMRLEALEPRVMLASDLQVAAFEPTGPGPFGWGEGMELNIDITNTGDNIAGGYFDMNFYLSDDATLEVGTDTLLSESYSIGNLDIGMTNHRVQVVTMPGSGVDGDKYLFVMADSGDSITENDENNNTAVVYIPVGAYNPATGIDLQTMDAGLPETIELIFGGTYTVAADAFNGGDTDAGAFDIDVVISPDATYDAGTDEVLATVNVSGGLTVGSESINDVDITLPTAGSTYGGHTYADGAYYVFVVADSGAVVTETFKSNNVVAQEVTLVTIPTLTSGVDLKAIDFDLFDMNNLYWDKVYDVEALTYNLGDANAGAFDISLALSADETYDLAGGDVTVGVIHVDSLDSTVLSYTESSIIMPPMGAMSDGSYYLLMRVDSGNAASDADSTNNQLSIPVNVAGQPPVTGPDLVLEGVFIDFAGGMPVMDWGDVLDVHLGVRNKGDQAATGTATIKFYLSDDATLEVGTDTLITETASVVDLGAGANNQQDLTITLPGSGTDGDMYLITVVDSEDVITEGVETNNQLIMEFPIGDISGMTTVIDLIPSNMGRPVIPMVDLAWGETYSIPVDITNQGDTDAGAFTVSVVLALPRPMGAGGMLPVSDNGHNELELATLNIASLTAGAESTNDVNITLPAAGILSDGNYNLEIRIDSVDMAVGGEVAEVFESNNFFGQPIQAVTTPTFSSGMDLQGVELFFDDPTAMEDPLIWGESYTVLGSVYNTGDTDATAFDIGVYLSTDQTFDLGTDTQVGTYTVSGGLTSGQFVMEEFTLSLPAVGTLADGNYKLLLVADSGEALTEGDESNNVFWMDVATGSPVDLVAQPVDVPGGLELKWGNSYTFTADVFNQGFTDAGAFDVIVAISPDDVYDAGTDQILATVNITGGLAAGEDSPNDAGVTLPTVGSSYGGHTYADGTYYLIVVADSGSTVTEGYEDNNEAVLSAPIVTTSSVSGTDIILIECDVELDNQDFNQAAQLAWGQTYTGALVLDYFNSGDTDAGAFDITFRLSDDPVYDDTDTLLGTENIASLTSLSLAGLDVDLVMPASGTDGAKYVVVKLDSGAAVTELDENNNTAAVGVQAGAAVSGIDVAPQRFLLGTPGPYGWNQTLQVTADVMNVGDTPSGMFDVKFYLSPTTDPAAGVELDDFTINNVPNGELAYRDFNVNLPGAGVLANGNYYLIMKADSGAALSEPNETNNTWSIPLAVSGDEVDVE